jgi:hypothetical protein
MVSAQSAAADGSIVCRPHNQHKHSKRLRRVIWIMQLSSGSWMRKVIINVSLHSWKYNAAALSRQWCPRWSPVNLDCMGDSMRSGSSLNQRRMPQ